MQSALRSALVWFVAIPLVVFVASASAATISDFRTLPDAPDSPRGTFASGLSKGLIVGYAKDEKDVSHGFVFDRESKEYSMLDVPGAEGGTEARGISAQKVVGFSFAKSEGSAAKAFVYDRESKAFEELDVPGATLGAYAMGIDGSTVVGYFSDEKSTRGFLYNGKEYQTLEYPDATGATMPRAVSRGLIGGSFDTEKEGTRGFLYDGKVYETIVYPEAVSTVVSGLFDANVVGYFTDKEGATRGFLSMGGEFTAFDYPQADKTYKTYATGISEDTIVGYYTDAEGFDHAFQASYSTVPVPEPSTLAILAAAGVVALVTQRARRR
jgi:hypothetical protein